ncbi:unnamed protein product [Strongylus vulgaris]|uniref:Uncharacterized protein n=1 Tax=Strongylus vulgaris TaxID=40348 RepID=A0A3P7IDE6_STRVU|nr:unnamed protein product [Strongylus vulgaris]
MATTLECILGRRHAMDAYELNPVNVPILKILCSTTGRLAEESGLKEKINLGFEFKKYLDQAVALDPFSFELLHMRGRFEYQVCPALNLFSGKGFIERLHAEQLRPGVTENRLYIGRVLHAKGDYITAKKWLTQILLASRVVSQKRIEMKANPFGYILSIRVANFCDNAACAKCEEDESVEREHISAARELLLNRVYQK